MATEYTITVESLAQALADVEDWGEVETACEWFYPPRVLAELVVEKLASPPTEEPSND